MLRISTQAITPVARFAVWQLLKCTPPCSQQYHQRDQINAGYAIKGLLLVRALYHWWIRACVAIAFAGHRQGLQPVNISTAISAHKIDVELCRLKEQPHLRRAINATLKRFGDAVQRGKEFYHARVQVHRLWCLWFFWCRWSCPALAQQLLHVPGANLR